MNCRTYRAFRVCMDKVRSCIMWNAPSERGGFFRQHDRLHDHDKFISGEPFLPRVNLRVSCCYGSLKVTKVCGALTIDDILHEPLYKEMGRCEVRCICGPSAVCVCVWRYHQLPLTPPALYSSLVDTFKVAREPQAAHRSECHIRRFHLVVQACNRWAVAYHLLLCFRSVSLLVARRRAAVCTRAVRKVSVHFEYLENRSRGLDVTWQPVTGDLSVHPLTVTLPWG
jgi:hypothetical protein